MASKNSIKTYIPNSFYHVCNRGVEKRNIFEDNQDFSVFLSYLKTYLTPKNTEALQRTIASTDVSLKEKDKAIKEMQLKNYVSETELICYALMPDHFHLLVRQALPVLNNFMNSLGTRYGMYFNRKYKRTGVLFQDVYKAVPIENDEQLLHLSRYIHLNPIKLLKISITDWHTIPLPFSLPEYLSVRSTDWIKSSYILDFFRKSSPTRSYESFMGLPQEIDSIADLIIDGDD